MSEKLKANDLRIGNAVYTVGGFGQPYYVEIIEIRESDVLTDNRKFETYTQAICDVEYTYEDIFGIPLTSEILLACGFIKKNNNHYSKDDFSYNLFNNQVYLTMYQITNVDTYYLHQLQNIYYFLSGEELEFKTELL